MKTPHLLSMLLIAASMLVACARTTPRAWDDTSSAKLDGELKIMVQEAATSEQTTDTKYAVFIRSSDAQALQKLQLDLGSRVGEMQTARVTLAQLREIAALPSVSAIQLSSKSKPQQ